MASELDNEKNLFDIYGCTNGYTFRHNRYGYDINIYFDNDLTQYTGVLIENNYIYVPFRLYEAIAGSELSWFPEEGEILIVTPVRDIGGFPEYDAELWVQMGSNTFYSQGLHPETGELCSYYYAGSWDGGQVYLKDDIAMVPLLEAKAYSRKTGGYSIFEIPLSTYYDGAGTLYFYKRQPVPTKKHRLRPGKTGVFLILYFMAQFF